MDRRYAHFGIVSTALSKTIQDYPGLPRTTQDHPGPSQWRGFENSSTLDPSTYDASVTKRRHRGSLTADGTLQFICKPNSHRPGTVGKSAPPPSILSDSLRNTSRCRQWKRSQTLSSLPRQRDRTSTLRKSHALYPNRCQNRS